MDIEFLLWLQDLRQAAGPLVESIANFITEINSSFVTVLIPCLMYWCFDKRAGLFVLANFGIANNLNQTIKDSFCVYRPWIRDSRIVPSAAALTHATGYSFPSGHTQGMVSVWGSAGWFKRREYPLLNILAWFLTILVGFTRLFLGVHTPQDVLVAFLEGLVVLAIIAFVWKRFPTIDSGWVLAVGLGASLAILLYTVLKSYPMDYVGEELLVDPALMKLDAYSNVGILASLSLGHYLEDHFVRFSCDISRREKLIRALVCACVLGLAYALTRIIKYTAAGVIYAFARGFFLVLAGVWAGPAIAERFRAHRHSQPGDTGTLPKHLAYPSTSPEE